MKPSLVFMMRLSGSVKFFCALGSGSSDGGAAGLPGFLRPSACRRSSACALALAAAAAFASASNSAFAARIFSTRFFLSATHLGRLLGRSVNLASRLERACDPGRILVSVETWNYLAGAISGEYRGKMAMKGFGEAIVGVAQSMEGP